MANFLKQNCMVLTRLHGSLSLPSCWQRSPLCLSAPQTRHFSVTTPDGSFVQEAAVSKDKKKGRKTVKSFTDLPSAYVSANGVVAAPLPEWNPDYLVPPPPFESVAEDEVSQPKRRGRRKKESNAQEEDVKPRSRRSKASENDVPRLKMIKVVDSANKAPRPTTFLAREILSNLRRFPHCLLLTRVGNFYESYFDQAVEMASLLNIKLTSRKWNGERVAMCGFPIPHLDRYLKILVQKERRFVAMCEEYARYDSDGIKEFERRISRIITPGTLIDESFLNPFDNNYLLAINLSPTTLSPDPMGLAWIDISTGEFFSKDCSMEGIRDELARLAPREIVLDECMKQHKGHPIFSALAETNCLVSYCTQNTLLNSGPVKEGMCPSLKPMPASLLVASNQTTTAEGLDAEVDTSSNPLQTCLASESVEEFDTMPSRETSATTLLTKFLQENLLEHMPLLNAPRRDDIQDRMQIDAHTIQGLEIRETGQEGSLKGSLLSVVKRTLTSGGTRLLARWLCSPSISVAEINNRQSLVSFFHKRQHFRADICEILKEVDDVSRLCQRFLLGRADFNDLISMNAAIGTWATLKQSCKNERYMEVIERHLAPNTDEWDSVETLFYQMTDLAELSERISQAVIDNSDSNELPIGEEVISKLNLTEEGETETQSSNLENQDKKWSINPNFSQKLSKVHALVQDLVKQKEKMEKTLQTECDAPSLTLRSTSQLGMFVHLSRAKRDRKKIDQDPKFHGIGETLSTKSYFYKDWTRLGNKITEAKIALNAAEKEVFDILRLEVIGYSDALRKNAHIIDELDVAISFAILAEEMNFVRPEIVEDSGSYTVVNGRHPAVEMGLLSSGRQFTPNSVEMTPTSNLHIITGPNMAGKSTFLRQTALIAILAQVGSFVPADYARISVVDKLFSRIGAKDDLFRDRSTFMVEMLETADILCRATDKSLVIMDEVGRGTTVNDGLAIAFASLHHIATVTKSRCLFATHFHELAEMLGNADNERGSGVFSNVRFYCSDVDDIGDEHFAYCYRLRPGINRDSHGLKVARLAGVPSSAMAVATDTLTWLRTRGTERIQLDYNDFFKSTLKSIP